MSGHSKWHNIKRKKELTDAKKAATFTKMSRLITVAARKGGADIALNPSLRLAVDKAKQAHMPKENIEKAVQKGVGGGNDTNFDDVVYEGFGPGGVAFMVRALTDNRNRTVAEVKNVFSKLGGSLGQPGSTSYIFDAETKEPTYIVKLEDEQCIERIQRLEDMLDDLDDVQEIYSNYQI